MTISQTFAELRKNQTNCKFKIVLLESYKLGTTIKKKENTHQISVSLIIVSNQLSGVVIIVVFVVDVIVNVDAGPIRRRRSATFDGSESVVSFRFRSADVHVNVERRRRSLSLVRRSTRNFNRTVGYRPVS